MKLGFSGLLSDFLDVSARVCHEVKCSRGDEVALLHDIDALWKADVLAKAFATSSIATLLFVQSTYHWMAGVTLAMSGNAVPTYPVLRAGLEAACYGYLLHDDEELRILWLQRDSDAGKTRAFRKQFGYAIDTTTKRLKQTNAGLASLIGEMHEASITFGAHPNPRSMIDHLGEFQDAGDRVVVELVAVNSPDSHNTTRALCAAAEHGLACAWLAFESLGDKDRAAVIGPKLVDLYQRKDALYPTAGS